MKALLLAQQSDEHELHKLNTQSGECVVKGIAFFGTPFQGSRLANFAGRLSFLLRVLPVNMSFIDHLRLKNATVKEIVDEFDALIRRMNLPLLIFYEEKKIRVLKIFKFRVRTLSIIMKHFLTSFQVTDKHSAFGRFAVNHAIRVPLYEDHRSIVRYLSRAHSFDTKVSPNVLRMIQGVLGQATPLDGSGAILKTWGPPHKDSVSMMAHIASPAADFSNTNRPTIFSQYASRDAINEESMYTPSMSMLFGENDVSDPFTQRFRAFEKDIRGCDSFDPVDAEPLDETCEWIQHRRAFQDWRDIEKSSILILEGAAGIGKSVLAKSIVEKLVKDKPALNLTRNTVAQAQKGSNKYKQDVYNTDQEKKGKDIGGSDKKSDEGRLVLSFFSSRAGRGNSPLSLLRHLMNQLLHLDPRALKASFRKLDGSSSTARDLQSSWELFKDACIQSSYEIYCIIDGLDECLKQFHRQPTSEIDEEMVQFLRRIYAVTDGRMGTQGSNFFKILITTRPKAEINLAAEGKNIIYRITNIDVTPGVEKLVRKEVQEFAATRGMTSETVEEISKRIIQRSGPLYLWARAFLQFIRKPDYQLGTRTGMMEGLDQFNLKNYDDVYDEALQNILPASRKALGRLMVFLYYSRSDMDLEELSHVLAIEPDDPSPSNFSGRIHGSLQCFIEQSCGALLEIIPINTTQVETKSIVTFRHQSVPEFLARLSPRDSPDYSCSPEATELNNCYLARLCLRYLILWRQQEASREEIEQSDGDQILALIKKSPFLIYAACEWDSHVRMAGAEIQPHMALVNQLLNIPTLSQLGQDYENMLTIRTRAHSQEWSDSWIPYPAENFLAAFNLTNILESYLHPYPQSVGYQKTICSFLKKIMPVSKRGKRLRKVNRSNTIDISMTDRNGNTMLHDACACGSRETAEYLLICGADGSLQNSDGDTPFSLAIDKGNESIAQLLLEKGESYDKTLDERKVTMLHSACIYGMTSIAQYLLAHGADPNAKSYYSWTPVHVAAQYGQLATLRILLLKGGNPAATNVRGVTPLHLAAQSGHLDVAKMLFDFNRELDPAPLTEGHTTPLFLAASDGHVDIFDYLYEKQPTVQATNDGWLPVHAAASSGNLELIDRLKDKSNMYAETTTGRLPIHIAALNGHMGSVETYIDLGVPVNIGCRDLCAPADSSAGKPITPLFLAAAHSGSKSLVTLLLQRGADIGVQSYRKESLLHGVAYAGYLEMFDLLREKLDPYAEDVDKRTPLMIAATKGHEKIVDFYLQAEDSNIAINKEDKSGWTPLLMALEGKHKEIALKLIEAGASVTHVTHENLDSPAHFAALLDDEQVFERLLNGRASFALQTLGGWTPLHVASHYGTMNSIRFLLRNGVDVNAQDMSDDTPLMIASRSFRIDAVRMLLAAGADPSLCDSYGLTPWDHAGHYEPIKDVFSEKFPVLERKTPQEQRSKFENALKQHLSKDICRQTERDRREAWWLMGNCFLKLDKLEEARICLEQRAYQVLDGEPWYYDINCDICSKELPPGAMHICAACPNNVICSGCYPERTTGSQPTGCDMTHQYIEVGGAKWKALPDGQVSEEETLEQWLHRQRQEFGVELSAQSNQT